jgi:cytochrome c oxidase subunit 3
MTQAHPVVPDPRSGPAPLATGRLGMRLLVCALGMLFVATLTGYLAIRGEAATWPPPGVPKLPPALWISTLLIVLSSVTAQWAVRGIRRGLQAPLRNGLLLTALLGVAFLVNQSINWFALVAVHFTAKTNLYGFLFYLLTGLHAAHVIGGLVPLGVVTVRAWRGAYTSASHGGVEYTATYWHFLDVVWLILFAVLTLTS